MFKCVSIHCDGLTVELIGDQLQIKVCDHVLLFDRGNTLEIKEFLTGEDPCEQLIIGNGSFNYNGCELGIHVEECLNVTLNEKNTQQFIKWVSENV